MTMSETTPAQGSPFWRFSLRFYREPGVADACIALQEEAGIDVNLLLFLLWHAAQAHRLSGNEVVALEQKIGGWREATVIPLRTLRRTLKSPPALVAAPIAEAFRTRIKAAELEAERLQQEAMYDLARETLLGEAASSSQQAAEANVAAYAQMRGVTFAEGAVKTLLAATAKFATTSGAAATQRPSPANTASPPRHPTAKEN
jgi:uncharacterized protein (TIGR02444 family)